jgi:putative ABC transport system ATP-binding protein
LENDLVENESIISLRQARFAHEKGRESGSGVLFVPHFDLKPEEALFLHGPSGSGKTTFLGLLTLVLSWDSGEMKLFGRDTGSLSAGERDRLRGEKIGYIFQMFNLVPYLSVQENILLPCRLNPARRNGKSDAELGAEALALAETLGIGEHFLRKATDLSVGQQQRVAAARAFIGDPGLVIADEPTSALDREAKDAFVELLLAQASRTKAAIVLVSHDRDLADHFQTAMALEELAP